MELQELTKILKELEVYSHRHVNEVFAGNYKSAFKGAGLEVKNIREYVAGDEAKYIDWVTSARHEKLYVKEFQETRELTTFLVIDVSASMNFGTEQFLKKEVMLRMAAILLYSALKNNDAMGMVVYADEVRSYIPAKKGQAHLLRILRELIEQLNQNEYAAADAEQALRFFNSVVKKQAITFLMADELNEQTGKALRIANTKHDFVFVNVFDEFERKIELDGLMEVEDVETGELVVVDFSDRKMVERYVAEQELKRQEFEGILRKHGVDLVDIETRMDVYKELLVFFKERQLRY